MLNRRWRFSQFLWPSCKTWTLTCNLHIRMLNPRFMTCVNVFFRWQRCKKLDSYSFNTLYQFINFDNYLQKHAVEHVGQGTNPFWMFMKQLWQAGVTRGPFIYYISTCRGEGSAAIFAYMFVCFKGGMDTGACPGPPFAWRRCLYFQK